MNPGDLDAFRDEVERQVARSETLRWNANPDDVKRSLMTLVLTLVEFIRQLLERQAIRRMDNETLTPEEIESLGQALMQLEKTVRDLARQFDIPLSELQLHLGPLGRLL